MNHYTYLITDTKTNMFYIGCRSCKCEPSEDSRYMGSCKSLKPIIKQRPQDFTKTILATHYNRYMAIWHECILHETFDVARSSLFYNRSKQKGTGWDTTGVPKTEEHKNKLRITSSGRVFNAETRRLISKNSSGKNNGMYGRKHSKETIEIMRQKKLGANHPMYGKHISEEARKSRLISRPRGIDHPGYGKPLSEAHKAKIRATSLEKYDTALLKTLREQGLSFKEISVIMGVPQTTLYYISRKVG